LEEYLHELTLANPESFESNNHCSDDSVSRNPNQTAAAVAASATNFTNAAILLQNSSSVYSRKVEYLHSLVLQTFQRLSNDEEKQNNSTTNKKRLAAADKDPDIQDFEAFDPHWNFLVFQEDTLPVDLEGNLIDLESHDNGATSTMEMDLQHPHYTANAHTPLMNMNQTRLSLGAPPTGNFGSISKLDLNATMRSVTRNKSSIQSHAGQQMIRSILEGSQGRNAFMMNGSGNGGGEGQAVLRLMNGVCDVSESGALLLPGTGIASARAMASADDSFGNADNQQPLQGKLNMNMELEDHDDGGQFDQGYDDGGDDDHDNDGIGFELHSPSNGHIQLTARGYGNGDGPVGIHATARNMNMPTGNGNNHHDNDTKTQSCPWDLLDPHDASESKSRPLRAAITYRLPHGVDQPPSSIVTGTRTKHIPRAKNDEQSSNNEEYPLEYTCLAVQDYRAALNQMGSTHYAGQSMDTSMDSADTNIDFKERLIPLPIQPLVFGEEFLYVLKSQQRQRTAEKRRIRRLERQQTQEISSSEAMDANERFDDMYDDNDDDNDGPAFELAGGDYDDGNDDDVNNAPDIFDQVFQQGENDNMECKTFEELCRAHLKEFAKGAERLAVETHLSKRVSIWQNKLEVILAEEEERHEFDIELYRSRIMTNVQDCLQKEHKSGEKGFVSTIITVERA